MIENSEIIAGMRESMDRTFNATPAFVGDSLVEVSLDSEEFARWETKDSGVRAEYQSGMVRDSQEGKPRFDLISPLEVPYEKQLLTRWASLMARGAVKYGDRNWEKGNGTEELERARASAFRHFLQWYFGEVDEDHAAAVLFNIQAAIFFETKLKNGSINV